MWKELYYGVEMVNETLNDTWLPSSCHSGNIYFIFHLFSPYGTENGGEGSNLCHFFTPDEFVS